MADIKPDTGTGDSSPPKNTAAATTGTETNSGQNSSTAATASSKAIGLPDDKSKTPELNQDNIRDVIGKLITAFLNKIGITNNVERQNIELTEGNAALTTGSIDQTRLATTVEKVNGIKPEILAKALPERSMFQSFSMEHTNHNQVQAQPVPQQPAINAGMGR